MIYLCSLWNKDYRDRGQALINSLKNHHREDCRLWVLTFEEEERIGLSYQSEYVTPIHIKDIHDERLDKARGNRSTKEFLWTCASFFTDYVMRKYRLDSLAYIDADCYLFHSLDPLYEEIGDADIAITPHRFTPHLRDWLVSSGEYNVGFVYFRNTETGMACLSEWKDNCLDWCYHRLEDGKYGDQAYLNDWHEKYGAHVIRHVGANLAPWNQLQYNYRDLKILHSWNGVDAEISPVLFYHFHGLGRNDYEISPHVAKYIYEPYLKELEWIRSGMIG